MKLNERYDAIVRRLGLHVASVQRRYPNAWRQIEQFRLMRGSEELGTWPAWCFVPLSGAYAVVTGGRNDVTPNGVDVAVVGALAAWRMSKGIYDFDLTVFEELWRTPVEGFIPCEVLLKLPEWCCYIPFESTRDVIRKRVHGFFVHLEHDMGTGRRELRLLLDCADDDSPVKLQPFVLHIDDHSDLASSVARAFEESYAQAKKHRYTTEQYLELMELAGYTIAQAAATAAQADCDSTITMAYMAQRAAEVVAPLISLTLYLCSTTAEILGRDGSHRPMNKPLLTNTKRGPRLFAAQEPQIWEVAWRLGKTLRAAGPGFSGPDRGGTHATPRPHIRRAHWHAFWTGPKAKGMQSQTTRKLILKWLPPIAVALGDDDHVIPTFHKVTK